MDASRQSADRTTPAGLRAAWIAAVAAGDADALRPLLAEDYEVWAHATASLCGIDATAAAMRAALARYHVEQSFEPVETVITGDWAFERGIETDDGDRRRRWNGPDGEATRIAHSAPKRRWTVARRPRDDERTPYDQRVRTGVWGRLTSRLETTMHYVRPMTPTPADVYNVLCRNPIP
jgi:ketosteroid isomerase-like protein